MRVATIEATISFSEFGQFLNKPIVIVAFARSQRDSLQLELEVDGDLRSTIVSSYDGPKTVGFQVIGGGGASFELMQLAIVKYLERFERDRLREHLSVSQDELEPKKISSITHLNGTISTTSMKYGGSGDIVLGLPRRAIVDTNVLLDATLIADGFGAKSLGALNKNKVALYVDEIAYRDAIRVLLQHQRRCPTVNLEELLSQCCVRHQILSVPPGNLSEETVKRQDRHLARAAKQLDAFIVTDDAPLLYQLHVSSIAARTTRQLVAFSYGESFPPVEFLVGGLNLGRGSSFHFTRCAAAAAILDSGRVEATLWEGRATGRFFYDRIRQGFVFQSQWSPEVLLPFRMRVGYQIIVALNFNLEKQNTQYISVRAAFAAPFPGGRQENLSSERSVQVAGHPPFDFGRDELRIANSFKLGNGWPGTIECMTWGPGKLRSDAWRTYKNVPGTAPNPLASDVVGVATSALSKFGNYVRCPRFNEIVATVANTIDAREPR